MHAAVYAALLTTLAAGPLAARDILLGSPLDCDLRGACFIQQYYDHDPTDAASDYRCATLSYDTHKGTDFALRTLTQMHLGVDVVAAAKGIVRATRDGMPDQIYNTQNSAEIDGRDCGNGVVIDHSDGWTTQYCHLKQGSVAVSRGDYVSFATRLGQVGLSGRTQCPHVHLTVRKDGGNPPIFNGGQL
jgi:murein DD-endopeptidase MepM/ murein hydrolase activator NlpD